VQQQQQQEQERFCLQPSDCGCWLHQTVRPASSGKFPFDITKYSCWNCMVAVFAPAEHLDSVAEQHAAALAPVIAGLQGEVSGLKSDLEQQRLAAAVAQQELKGARGRLAEVCMQMLLV
jgi:hypothetical protein